MYSPNGFNSPAQSRNCHFDFLNMIFLLYQSICLFFFRGNVLLCFSAITVLLFMQIYAYKSYETRRSWTHLRAHSDGDGSAEAGVAMASCPPVVVCVWRKQFWMVFSVTCLQAFSTHQTCISRVTACSSCQHIWSFLAISIYENDVSDL
jgi:hypothetical protein